MPSALGRSRPLAALAILVAPAAASTAWHVLTVIPAGGPELGVRWYGGAPVDPRICRV